MPHWYERSRLAARGVSPVALLWVLACARDGEVTVLLDTTSVPTASVVLAVPVDPETLRTPPVSSRATGAAADTLTRFIALRDSTAALDARFQAVRAALNAEARDMSSLDRRTPAYARRFDAFRARELAADSLRTARDRQRSRETRQRTLLAHLLPSPDAERLASSAYRTALLAARVESRRGTSVTVSGTATRLSLAPGSWWIGIASAGGAPAIFQRIEVREGVRDTLRVGAAGAS